MKTITLQLIAVTLALAACKQQVKEELPAKDAITDPLPSWNDGVSKKAIVDFVSSTTKDGSAAFIPVADRVACFDNDGTLWSEQPMYFQLAYALDQVRAHAAEHPEWKTMQPFKALLEAT